MSIHGLVHEREVNYRQSVTLSDGVTHASG